MMFQEEENPLEVFRGLQFGRAMPQDSATSGGLGESPRSAVQDLIQAPPGTHKTGGIIHQLIEQPEHAGWAVPGSSVLSALA
ncbi:hypothetical protein TNCV_2525961 [Trichonephila clavipes]|nr:hypothetical protein TNCV_2525961 [Trichonephila clavipes]